MHDCSLFLLILVLLMATTCCSFVVILWKDTPSEFSDTKMMLCSKTKVAY